MTTKTMGRDEAVEWLRDHVGDLRSTARVLRESPWGAKLAATAAEVDKAADEATLAIAALRSAVLRDGEAKQPAAKPDAEADETGVEFFAVPEGLHPNTVNLVARFATALAEKLAAAERKYGYSDGWADAGWMDECRQKLVEHIAKGDPRDVAAYCAFLWHHNESTAGAKHPDAVAGLVDEAMVERAVDAFLANTGQEHKVTDFQRELTTTCMRAALTAALAQQPAAVDGLAARLVDELDGLVGESDGVSGLHLNGDVATWEELLPGGRFERLSSLDELRAALAAQPGGGK